MFKMSAFSVETGRQTTPPLVDGVVHNKHDTFITSLAILSLTNKQVNACPVFRFRHCKNY